jgi:formylmethanofuran--tetrahydromethanopterin N-formyltransferase
VSLDGAAAARRSLCVILRNLRFVKVGSTIIDDTFAEGFGMRYARLVITAHDDHWLHAALAEFAGFATSVIGCDVEIGCERRLTPAETPDGREGVAVLVFGFSREGLARVIPLRVGQSLMTCPTSAVYNGLPDAEIQVPMGQHLRYFGDGFQKSKLIGGRRFWRIPVMEGEFLVEEKAGVADGIAGGNIIIQGADADPVLAAARLAVAAVAELPGVITPFPGGVARSGSKVGSRYRTLKASTADAFCPTLRGRVDTRLHAGVNVALEIVINGINQPAVRAAMAAAALAAAGDQIIAISAGNYGGKLGPYHFPLREVIEENMA